MTEPLLVNNSLAQRLILADAAGCAALVSALAALPGNPFGADVWHAVEAVARGTAVHLTALSVPLLPGPTAHLLNRTLGLDTTDLTLLPDLVTRYRAACARWSIETLPGSLTPVVARRLHLFGLRQAGFASILVAEPLDSAGAAAAAAAAPLWRTLGLPAELDDASLASTGWVGFGDGLAGRVRDGLAWCVPPADDAGAVACRAWAAAQQCDVVAARALPWSAQEEALLAAGFRLAYNTAVWVADS